MRDNYFEENRRMLVRHQADATTRHIDQASGMPGGRRASQERLTRFDALRYGRTASLAWRGAARPDAYLGPSRPRVSRLVGARRRAPKYPLDKTGVYALLSQRGPVVNRRGRPDIAQPTRPGSPVRGRPQPQDATATI